MKTDTLHIDDQDIEFPAEGRENIGAGSASGTEPVPISMTFRRSALLGKLVQALCKANDEFPDITKDTENPYFRSQYADLATLIKATKPSLSRNGLAIFQPPASTATGVKVTTLLAHISEQWVECDLEMPSTKADAQGKGSAITYARRYSYQAILNIAAEEDDDGNAAVGKTQQDRYSKGSTETGPGCVNPTQMRAIQSACKSGGKSEQQLSDYLGSLGYESLEELPKSEQNAVVKWALARG